MAAAATILDVVKSEPFLNQLNVVEQIIKKDFESGALDLLAIETASQENMMLTRAELAKMEDPSVANEMKVGAAKKAVAHASNALNLWMSKASELEHIPDELAKKLNAMRGIQTYLLHLIEDYDIPLTIESPSAVAARTTVAEESTEEGAAPESPSLPRRPTPPGLFAGRRFSMATGMVAPEVAAALADVRGGGGAALSIPPSAEYFTLYLKALLKTFNKIQAEDSLKFAPALKEFKNLLVGEMDYTQAFLRGDIATSTSLYENILERLKLLSLCIHPKFFDSTLRYLGLQAVSKTDYKLDPDIFTADTINTNTVRTKLLFAESTLTVEESADLTRLLAKRHRRVSTGDRPVSAMFEIPRKAEDGTEVAPSLLASGAPRALKPRTAAAPAAEAPFLGAVTMAAYGGGSSTPAPAPAPSRAK